MILKSFSIGDMMVQLAEAEDKYYVRFVAGGVEQRELVFGSYAHASLVFNQWVENICFIMEHNHKF